MCTWLVRKKVLLASPFATIDIRVRLPARLPRCLKQDEVANLIAAGERADSTSRLAVGDRCTGRGISRREDRRC